MIGKIGKLTKTVLLGDGTVEPFKCRICGEWAKHKSKAKDVCRECYNKLK